MEELERIFVKRDNLFEKQTLEIFRLINTSIICINKFLNSVDPMFNAGNIIWEEANVIEDLIILVGTIEYKPGTNIQVEGTLVSITEENIEYFQRVIHMSLPFKLVNDSNEDEIMKFLYNLYNEGNGENFSEIINHAPNDSIDFDLSKLTKAQRESLMIFTNKQKHNN